MSVTQWRKRQFLRVCMGTCLGVENKEQELNKNVLPCIILAVSN